MGSIKMSVERQSSFIALYLEEAKQVSEIVGKDGRKGAPKGSKGKLEDALNAAESIQGITYHSCTMEKFLSQIELSNPANGLSDKEAAARHAHYGPNKLTEKTGTPWYVMFIKHLTGFFSLLLWVGSILCFIAYGLDDTEPSNLWLGLVLAIVVFLTGCFSFYQDAKSAAVMAKFKDMAPPKCSVIRNGQNELIEASYVVPGDVVLFKEGDKIAADMRIIECDGIKIDQASLTGESDLIKKNILDSDKKPLEADNLAFFGTLCKGGAGKGVVFNIGDKTVIGSIAHLASTAETEQTPINKEIHRFIKLISIIAITLGVVFFIMAYAIGYDPITNIVFCIGIIVANVPEGLLATVTVSLTLTAQRMASKNVLVKNLESVETLGSTTCICSDKTGTLTQNIMTVASVVYDNQVFVAKNYQECKDDGKERDIEYDISNHSFTMLHKVALMNNSAGFNYMPEDKDYPAGFDRKLKGMTNDQKKAEREKFANEFKEVKIKDPVYKQRTTGNASDGALLKFFEVIRSRADLLKAHPQVASVPFNSTDKYAITIHAPSSENDRGHEGDVLVLLKGAPEKVFAMSRYVLKNDDIERKKKSHEQDFFDANDALGQKGQRVLGFAYMYLPGEDYPDLKFVVEREKENFPLEGFTFVGVIGLQDPPRKGVPEAVLKCQSAGIKVIMVTGDQQVTAQAIAREVNIITLPKTVNDYVNEENERRIGQYGEKATLANVDDFLDASDAIVIHGDLLGKVFQDDQKLPENQRGFRLNRWLQKKEVVFARTTPAQKLIIVEGCQKQKHIVAVTGDGVNDSPAIKKADIGIAMNIVGSDVAKDAADMLLMDDNFASIVKGVEEGRLIFDNLKKSIAYTLSSNIPEIGPFISFIIFQLPLPLSTVLILCVDLGTDMIPAISLAYENPELDIMRRKPRNAEIDHLVNSRLINFSYLQIGIIQCLAGFYTYFVVMNDYGFPPSLIFFFALRDDGRDPNDPNASTEEVDWITNDHDDIDLRDWYNGEIPRSDFSECRYPDKESDISDAKVCYTTEALRHAQTAYFVSIVVVQWADLLICKTRKLSITQQGMKNMMLNFGLFSETALCILLCYVPPLNVGLGTRDLEILHLGVPAMPYFVIIFTYDETRKWLMRKWYKDHRQEAIDGKVGWVERNTYY